MIILRLAGSFKTMNRINSTRPDPTRPDLNALRRLIYLKAKEDRDVEFWHNLSSDLQFVSSKFGIVVFDGLEQGFPTGGQVATLGATGNWWGPLVQNRILGGHARLKEAATQYVNLNRNLQIVMLMQPTLAPIDQFPNLDSIIHKLHEDDCGVHVEL